MRVKLGTAVVCGMLAVSVQAQETRLVECLDTSLFGPGCPPSVPMVVWIPEPVQPVDLFPPQTLAPDTPPLFIELLRHPDSDEAADAFLDWQEARLEANARVTAKLKERWAIRKGQR